MLLVPLQSRGTDSWSTDTFTLNRIPNLIWFAMISIRWTFAFALIMIPDIILRTNRIRISTICWNEYTRTLVLIPEISTWTLLRETDCFYTATMVGILESICRTTSFVALTWTCFPIEKLASWTLKFIRAFASTGRVVEPWLQGGSTLVCSCAFAFACFSVIMRNS